MHEHARYTRHATTPTSSNGIIRGAYPCSQSEDLDTPLVGPWQVQASLPPPPLCPLCQFTVVRSPNPK
eukprot:6533037-Prymnesium_polylepis.1